MITTRAQISREVNNFYDRTLLERLKPLLVYLKWAQIRDIPRKSGTNTIKFRRYNALPPATTPLTEGQTPAGSQLSITDVIATVAQYGDYITVTDVVDYESPDAVLTEGAELLGEQAALTLDVLTRDILTAGTTVSYVGQTSRAAITSADKINTAEIRKAVRILQKNKARKVTTIVNPDDGYNTSPIAPCYVGIVSPEVVFDLKGLTEFIPVEKYANKANVMEGEVGALDEVRFVMTSEAKVFAGAGATGIDVHCVLILGADAYGVTRISGEAIRNIIKPLGSAGSADPLNQRATSGWKATFTAKILNQLAMIRVECAAS